MKHKYYQYKGYKYFIFLNSSGYYGVIEKDDTFVENTPYRNDEESIVAICENNIEDLIKKYYEI